MQLETILITGSTGRLGRTLMAKGIPGKILAPSRAEMNITSREAVNRYFETNEIDVVIHCAALTDMKECETNPSKAVEVNLSGTAHLVEASLKKPKTRFIYISTDYVYPGTRGSYKESDSVLPFTPYAWSKLGGECAVNLVPNHCIIRTSLFDPENIPFDTAPSDAYCSKISFSELAEAVKLLILHSFTGIINVGSERTSHYDLFKRYKPSIQPVSLAEINKTARTKRAADSSLDISLWKKTRNIL